MCSKPGKARHWALLLGFQQAHQQQGTVAVSCDPWQQVQGPKRCTAGDFHMELSNRNRPEMMGSDGLMGVLLMGVLHMKSRLMTWWCGLWLMIFVRGKKCFVWKQKTFGVKPSLGNWDYKGRTSLRTVPGTPTCFHKSVLFQEIRKVSRYHPAHLHPPTNTTWTRRVSPRAEIPGSTKGEVVLSLLTSPGWHS